jgi:hypothetical protein
MIVAGPGMVGVGVRDHGARDSAMRIDMEGARPAEQPRRSMASQDSNRSAFIAPLCGTKHAFVER